MAKANELGRAIDCGSLYSLMHNFKSHDELLDRDQHLRQRLIKRYILIGVYIIIRTLFYFGKLLNQLFLVHNRFLLYNRPNERFCLFIINGFACCRMLNVHNVVSISFAIELNPLNSMQFLLSVYSFKRTGHIAQARPTAVSCRYNHPYH